MENTDLYAVGSSDPFPPGSLRTETTDLPTPNAFGAVFPDPSLPRKSDVRLKNIREHMLGKLGAPLGGN